MGLRRCVQVRFDPLPVATDSATWRSCGELTRLDLTVLARELGGVRRAVGHWPNKRAPDSASFQFGPGDAARSNITLIGIAAWDAGRCPATSFTPGQSTEPGQLELLTLASCRRSCEALPDCRGLNFRSFQGASRGVGGRYTTLRSRPPSDCMLVGRFTECVLPVCCRIDDVCELYSWAAGTVTEADQGRVCDYSDRELIPAAKVRLPMEDILESYNCDIFEVGMFLAATASDDLLPRGSAITASAGVQASAGRTTSIPVVRIESPTNEHNLRAALARYELDELEAVGLDQGLHLQDSLDSLEAIDLLVEAACGPDPSNRTFCLWYDDAVSVLPSDVGFWSSFGRWGEALSLGSPQGDAAWEVFTDPGAASRGRVVGLM